VRQASIESPARSLAPALAALLLGALVLFDARALNDGDTYWHIATGDWILDHARVPHVDVFSNSTAGAPWVAQEWLSEVLMALARRAAGWAGVVVLFAAAIAAAAWLIVRRMSLAIGGVTLALASVLVFACMGGSLLARPHLLALPVLLVWTLSLMSAREKNRAPPIVLALLMLVWANLHGGFVLGFAVAAAFGSEALLEARQDRGKVVRDWGLFGAASLLAALVTPHGLTGLIYPFQVMTMTSLPGITEWRAADFAKPTAFEAALLITLFVCLWRGVRVPILRLLLLLGLLHLALQHSRHQLVLAALAPLILAEPLAVALGHAPARARLNPGLLAASAAAAIGLLAVRLALPVVRVDGLNSPVAAVASLPPQLLRQPVLNEYGFGGYLIFQGARPFIDGRSDMYGDAFTGRYFAAETAGQADLDRFLDRHGVAWTIFAPSNPIVATLDGDRGWRRIHTDATAVVHQRVAPIYTVKVRPTSPG